MKLKSKDTFWFNGKKITKEEHDKLSWDDIFAYNNKIGK
jgi:hypothetical protein